MFKRIFTERYRRSKSIWWHHHFSQEKHGRIGDKIRANSRSIYSLHQLSIMLKHHLKQLQCFLRGDIGRKLRLMRITRNLPFRNFRGNDPALWFFRIVFICGV